MHSRQREHIATVMTRAATTNRTQGVNQSHTFTPALLNSRSTCLIACFGVTPIASASPRPMA